MSHLFPKEGHLNLRLSTHRLPPKCLLSTTSECLRNTSNPQACRSIHRSKLEPILNTKRAQFNQQLEATHSRMNSSFSGWLAIWNKQNHKNSQQRKVAKQAEVVDVRKDENEKIVWDNSKLSARKEFAHCFEETFQIYRLGATLVHLDESIYIFGGTANGMDVGLFALRDGEERWRRVDGDSMEKPVQMPCFHSVEKYKQFLMFIGGVSIDVGKNRRYFSSAINLFDTIRKEWSKLRWNVCVRSHASVVCGNTLMIYGGLNEKEQYLSTCHFLPLNTARMTQSVPLSIQLPAPSSSGIAFHQIVSTHDIELRNRINLDAAICFGGKHADGKILQDPMCFKLNFMDQNWEGQVQSHRWEMMSVKGKRPPARYSHSMSIIDQRGVCVIIGGLNYEGKPLGDAWVLDLVGMAWLKAQFETGGDLIRSIGYHGATCANNSIFLYQGSQLINVDFVFDRVLREQQRMKDLKRKNKARMQVNELRDIVS